MSAEPLGAPPRPLTVRRTIRCHRGRVFDAWTDPDALLVWWPGKLGKTLTADVDLRVGGSYRLTMRSGKEVAALEGVYREVEPPQRLVYTWCWDRVEIDGGRESLVTVEFLERGDATEVVVTHAGVDESRVFHEGGWTASLEGLAELLARGSAHGRRSEEPGR